MNMNDKNFEEKAKELRGMIDKVYNAAISELERGCISSPDKKLVFKDKHEDCGYYTDVARYDEKSDTSYSEMVEIVAAKLDNDNSLVLVTDEGEEVNPCNLCVMELSNMLACVQDRNKKVEKHKLTESDREELMDAFLECGYTVCRFEKIDGEPVVLDSEYKDGNLEICTIDVKLNVMLSDGTAHKLEDVLTDEDDIYTLVDVISDYSE